MKLLTLIALSLLMVACATETRPLPIEDPTTEEVNLTAENLGLIQETIQAAESTVVCGTWTIRNLVARPVVNFLQVIPFFAGTPDACPNQD